MIRMRLAQLLLDREMNLRELARRVGVTHKNLWRLKKGKAKELRLEVLDELCRALRCQPGDLFAFEEAEPVRRAQESLPAVAPAERKVLEACEGRATDIDDVIARSGLEALACFGALTNLELARHVVRRGGS